MTGATEERGRTVAALAVLLAGCVFHAVAYDYVPASDALIYLERARQFASGRVLDPATNWNLAPGYSAFLAVPIALGISRPILLILLQATVAFAAFRFLVGRLAESGTISSSGRRIAIWAFSANPLIWAACAILQSEAFGAALMMWVLGLAWPRGSDGGVGGEGSLPRSVLLAAACTALVLTRVEVAVLLAVLVVSLAIRGRGTARWWRPAGAIVIGVALAIGVNLARNQAMFGRTNPASFGGGVVLYAGVNQSGDAAYHPGPCGDRWTHEGRFAGYVPPSMESDFRTLCASGSDEAVRAPRLDSLFREAAALRRAEDGVGVVATWPSKFGRLWLLPNFFDIYTADESFRPGVRFADHLSVDAWGVVGAAKHVAYIVLHLSMLMAIAAGLGRAARVGGDARNWAALIGLLALVQTAMFVVAFYGLPRFHAPLLPTLLTALAFLAGPPPRPRPGPDPAGPDPSSAESR